LDHDPEGDDLTGIERGAVGHWAQDRLAAGAKRQALPRAESEGPPSGGGQGRGLFVSDPRFGSPLQDTRTSRPHGSEFQLLNLQR